MFKNKEGFENIEKINSKLPTINGDTINSKKNYNEESNPLLNSWSEEIMVIVKDDKSNSKEEGESKNIRTGSIASAIFNLSNGIIGSSMLAIPYTIYCTGMVTGVVIITVVIVLTLFTLYVLVESSFLLGGVRTYQRCIEMYLGKYWKKVAEVCILIYSTGSMIVYFVIIGDFIKSFIDYFLMLVYGEIGNYFFNNQKMITVFFGIIIIFPLTLIREVKNLGCASIFAFSGVIYLTFFLVISGIIKYSKNGVGKGVKDILFLQTKLYTGFYYPIIFLAIPIQCLEYICHVMIFPISYEIKKGTTKKTIFVCIVSVIICSFAYFSSALFGFFSFGKNLKDNVLNNYNRENIFANISRATMGLNLVFSFPLQNYSSRLVLKSVFFGEKKEKLGTFTYASITTFYFFIILVIALFVPEISTMFGLMGSLGCFTLMFFFPGLLCWKVLAKEHKKFKIFFKCSSILLIVLTVVFGISGLIASIIKLIISLKTMFH